MGFKYLSSYPVGKQWEQHNTYNAVYLLVFESKQKRARYMHLTLFCFINIP